jgi:pyruvate kinase
MQGFKHMEQKFLAGRFSKTKIVATVGPACESLDQLKALIIAGVDVFRLNMAHGARPEHEVRLAAVRQAVEQTGQFAAVLVDLAGPKIRLGELPGGQMECHAGASVRFVRGTIARQAGELTTTYQPLVDELAIGDRVMLADGIVSLVVEQRGADFAQCRVVQPGLIRSRQGVNLPGVKLSVPTLGPADRENALWAAQNGIDFIGLSFVRSADDVRQLKSLLAGPHPNPLPMGEGTISNTYQKGEGTIFNTCPKGEGTISNTYQMGEGTIFNTCPKGEGTISNTYQMGEGKIFNTCPKGEGSVSDTSLKREGAIPIPASLNTNFIPQVIAKIEKPEAMDHLDEIVAAADGIMVARGDLGVETDIARVALAQKQIIALCNRHRKPVIVATQMLDSMQHSLLPTRAEVTDVANAILDGADACMLSGETAIGDYPQKTVETMHRIALATEPMLPRSPFALQTSAGEKSALNPITQAIVDAAGRIAEQVAAKLILVASSSGQTALALSKDRNSAPVVGVSESEATLRRMCLYWGVFPLAGAPVGKSMELLDFFTQLGRQSGYLNPGDRLVLIIGTALSASAHNAIVVHQIRD